MEGYETQFGYERQAGSNEELISMFNLHKKKKRILFWLKCQLKGPQLVLMSLRVKGRLQ